jgi:hypothetical protein
VFDEAVAPVPWAVSAGWKVLGMGEMWVPVADFVIFDSADDSLPPEWQVVEDGGSMAVTIVFIMMGGIEGLWWRPSRL